MWIRTCQECGHQQFDQNPNGLEAPQRKCRKCKSPALDYGKEAGHELFEDADKWQAFLSPPLEKNQVK